MGGATRTGGTATGSIRRLLLFGIAAGGLFAAGLIFTEGMGEVGLDVDFKPFFLPYFVIATADFDERALSASVGAGLGEGLLDIVEGYEADDPFGFLGYVVGFLVFGWLLREVAPDDTDGRWQALACLAGAATQACFEGAAFYVLSDVGVTRATLSVLGNTVTHGLLLGAIPFVLLFPGVRRRFVA
jgi:hypothetical protein